MSFDNAKVLFTGNFKGIATQRLRGNVPQGFYPGKIVSLEEVETGDGDAALRIDFTPAAGEFMGTPLTTTQRYPKQDDPKDFPWKVWRALLRSVGYTEEQIDSGAVKMSGNVLLANGGNVWFHCQEPAAEGDYAQYTWLAKEDFDRQVAMGGTGPKARAKKEGTGAGATASGIGGQQAAPGIGAPPNGAPPPSATGTGLAHLDRVLGIGG